MCLNIGSVVDVSGEKMKKIGFLLVTLLFLKVNAGSAAIITFFGEDVNRAGDPTVANRVNSSGASGQFLANLAITGTETFEGFPTGTFVPLTANFSGLGSAVLSGSGTIASGNDGGGRFPVSGSKYLITDAGQGFNLRFNSPVSAFGFYATDIGDYGGQIVLTLTNTGGQLSTLTVPNTIGADASTSGSVLYYAFIDSANAYTNIQFSDTSVPDIFAFDNITVGSVNAAPEPGAFALMGLGMTGLFGLRYVKRNRASRN
jgi:PEP-CTERM motif